MHSLIDALVCNKCSVLFLDALVDGCALLSVGQYLSTLPLSVSAVSGWALPREGPVKIHNVKMLNKEMARGTPKLF